jgi:phage repressor protein C with HTH and peptisase S24 domain
VLEGVSALGNPAGIPSQFQVMADRTLWLPQLPAGNVYFAIKVAGDSMAPFYDDSDTIVITPLTQPAYYVPDRIYVVVMRDSTVFIKRLRPSMFGSTKGALELVSENSRYAPMYIDPTEVVCMYEIAARITLTL